jgi:DNA modification methylase
MNRLETMLPSQAVESAAALGSQVADQAAAERSGDSRALGEIRELNAECERRYKEKLLLQPALSRSLVSFEANKGRPIYRWFKYKEAFSAGLVEFLLDRCRVSGGPLLDPFAGIGTALFAAGSLGVRAEGIELLPLGQRVIAARQLIDWNMRTGDVAALARWAAERPWEKWRGARPINELRITKGAYPPETVEAMGRYLAASENENERVRALLLFVLLCVLESISFTRKDGQYLRWDYRSSRRRGKKLFDKGAIRSFAQAICPKLGEVVADLRRAGFPDDLPAKTHSRAGVTLHNGSCLEILPRLSTASYHCVLTSPPYCNRYDYTRTYALELALLGTDEAGIVKLRQEMLSCTVENRAKNLLEMNPQWQPAIAAADRQRLLQRILACLDQQRQSDLLNNNGIPRMVRGYFYEMACVIAECRRVLKRRAPLIMVNDNVRYAGASISVDLILSDIAQELGFEVEHILVLPNSKGNSSQQMGLHGRERLRKCVYVWRKL